VGELADKFSCSRRHLNRLFHQHFGFSVAALRMEMRLLKAVSLLREPDAKVINVAEQCGFNHLGLFNICFKRRFGNSPGQWRKLTSQAEGQRAGLTEAAPTCPLKSNGLCPWSGKPELVNPAMTQSPQVRKGSPTRVLAAANGTPNAAWERTATTPPTFMKT
jgi:AraC-like DNA-binding protein